uniref:Proteoglycan 4-like n=1 Tax=Cicer arietinum TaxID=3827 RepID=A0A3Q7XM82_CICAR|nr:proteoglycan 4-like [Cicer arietinum]
MRVQYGIGTSKPLNPKPHYFIISDSETDDSSDSCPPSATTPQNNPTSTSEKAPTHIKSTTPSKSAFSSEPSQSTPPHQKWRLNNEIVSPLTKQNEPSSQSKPQTKPMKTKSAMTIAQFLARKKLPNPHKRKTLAPKQNLKHCQPASPERSPILECSPIQTPFFPPSQEHSPNQERSPAHSVPPLEPFPHTQPSSSTHANQFPTPERSSTSTLFESEPSPPPKKSKQNTPPLIPSSKTKLFKSKWAQRPMLLDRPRSYKHLKATIQLPTEGPHVFGDNWYSTLNLRKTEVLSDLFEEDSTHYLSTYLKPLPKVFNNMCQHTLIPHCGSHEYVSDNDTLLIHHLLNSGRRPTTHLIPFSSNPFNPEENPANNTTPKPSSPNPERSTPPPECSPEKIPTPSNLFPQTSTFLSSTLPSFSQTIHSPSHDFGNFLSNPHFSTMSPLFVSPQKTSSSIFGISQFLNFSATVGPSNTSIDPLPSISSSFATFPSVSTNPIPSNIVVATTSQPSTHLHSSPRLVEPSNTYIMAALHIIMAHQVQHDQEIALLRTWLTEQLAPKLEIAPPPPHLVPPPSQVPHPRKSSSSEGSSPSLAS